MVLTKSGFPEKLHIWLGSCNELILLLQSKHKYGIHPEGTKTGDSFWFRRSAPRLLGGGVDQ